MKAKIFVAAILSCIASAVIAASPLSSQKSTKPDPASFTVLAEPQLVLPMTEITRLYSLRHGVSILTAFDDSVEQEMKLLDGEQGDVLITSYPAVITDLRQRGMIDVYSQASVTADKLVLAAAKKEGRSNHNEVLTALATQPLLLANSGRYIEGLYGRTMTQYLYYGKPLPMEPKEYTLRGMLYDAINKENGIGILLQSEAQLIDGIDLIIPLADSSYPPVIYQAFAVAGENMPVARSFIQFLRSAEAQQIFMRYGFTQP